MSWTPADIPDLSGRRTVVTGATSGIGREAAAELGRHGAHVVLAGRSADKLRRTRAELADLVPGAAFDTLLVDVSELASVRRAADELLAGGEPVHLLLNNAGVMATPHVRTGDGFELQLATNHLGPFLLTGLLLPLLVASGSGRVVAVSSHGHRLALRAPLSDPRRTPWRYSRWEAYAQSKLADLVFARELDRRLHAAGLPVTSLAAHPGYSATSLGSAGRAATGESRRAALVGGAFAAGQPAYAGAWPLLMAATAPLPGSSYVGPGGPGQLAGPPRVVSSSRLSRDPEVARRLWEVSEQATGISYP